MMAATAVAPAQFTRASAVRRPAASRSAGTRIAARPPTHLGGTVKGLSGRARAPLAPRAEGASPKPPPGSGLSPEVEEATKKYGLEAGLWKAFKTGGDGGDGKPGAGAQAKELIKVYGSAYLVTSISLSTVSIFVCYALVNGGVDMGSLLSKVGLEVTTTSTNVGTFALAYAAHKALSPVRFPPTVALTPIVAKAMGKEIAEEDKGEGSA